MDITTGDGFLGFVTKISYKCVSNPEWLRNYEPTKKEWNKIIKKHITLKI